jgi:phosphoglycerate kinase
MRLIQNADVKNKKVLLRVDFNVAIENGKVGEQYKIKACKESLDYLVGQQARVALISHLGRPAAVKTLADKPEGKPNPEFSLEQISDEAEKILGAKIKFTPDCIGDKVKEGLDNLKEGEILLLENVRFYEGEDPATSDEASDNGARKNYFLDFSKKLAENFDLFINDAFSVCHRDQASVTGVAKILPSYAGFWLQKEIENLDKIKNNPGRPAVAIIGGAKIETKLPLINSFEKNYDNILVGGKVANEAIDQKLAFGEKVILPVDFGSDRMDIGPETIEKFAGIIKNAKTIVWNGPMGKFEESEYAIGTNKILEAVINSGAFTLMGGGESVELLEKENALDKISFVSTGGGAMLEYLSGNPMPGIEALA